MKQLTEINLHGILGEHVGKTWKLSVNSVGEALRGIEILSKRKLYKFLLENDKRGVKYRVLINKRDFISESPISIEKPETIKNSELCATFKKLESIDIVPIICGGGDVFLDILQIVIGAVLIVVAAVTQQWWAIPVVLAGIGMIASGVIGLLTKPPTLQEYNATKKTSYLFSGPANVVSEGIPVPLCYGRLLVGSVVISADYDSSTYFTGDAPA